MALAEYGLQVITAWIAKKQIFQKCKERGMGLAPVYWLREGVDELANETVAFGIAAFRDDVLMHGRWSADRGASLKTFFIGQCLFQFPNVYRRWVRETRPRPTYSLVDELEPSPVPSQPVLLELARCLRTMRPGSTEWIAGSMAMGESQADVASAAGISEKALESRLVRLRRRSQQ